jgi:CTP synthase (UTP-ammonia lyase)
MAHASRPDGEVARVNAPAVAILGEFSPTFEPHALTDAAIEHAAAALGATIHAEWISTLTIDVRALGAFSGIWVAPGSPYLDMARTLQAIRYARVHGVPCLGTCGGMQHMILEYARNVLGHRDAQHAEYDPYASDLFVSRLACSLAGREMQLELRPGSRVAHAYGGTRAVERYYCDFGINPERVPELCSGPLQVVGSDAEGAIRVVELPGHPFFVGTLYVPQARSRPGSPHPLIVAFLRAAAARCLAP